jgi:hypothetical protein
MYQIAYVLQNKYTRSCITSLYIFPHLPTCPPALMLPAHLVVVPPCPAAVYLLPYSDTPGRYYMYTFSCNYGEVVSFDGTNTMTTLKPLPQWPNPDYW